MRHTNSFRRPFITSRTRYWPLTATWTSGLRYQIFVGVMGTIKCKPLFQHVSCVENPFFYEPSAWRVEFEDFGLEKWDPAVRAKGPTPLDELEVWPPSWLVWVKTRRLWQIDMICKGIGHICLKYYFIWSKNLKVMPFLTELGVLLSCLNKKYPQNFLDHCHTHTAFYHLCLICPCNNLVLAKRVSDMTPFWWLASLRDKAHLCNADLVLDAFLFMNLGF